MRTFEMVLGGHPDKMCDIIAEAVKSEHKGKTAVEVVWFGDTIIVGGEVTDIISDIDVKATVNEVLNTYGYNDKPIIVKNLLQEQSKEIADIVNKNNGAGDNGIFFAGWHYKWSPIIKRLKVLSRFLTNAASSFNYRTDGKFIAEFDNSYKLETFTLNIASKDNNKLTKKNKNDFHNFLATAITLAFDFNPLLSIKINPKGDWHKCGGFADSGLTGRKLACDNSMGLFHQGGGAFFGKDVSKADYSVPLFLQNEAKLYVESKGFQMVEISAHTIIGDDNVKMYINGQFYKVISYSDIMNYALDNPMDWTGL